MMQYVARIGLLLFLAQVLIVQADASYYVCGNATTLQYAVIADPSQVPACLPPFVVDMNGVPEGDIPAQRTLYDAVPHHHIKVISGLMVEMTQAEKDAVDLPGQQKAAATSVAKQELAENPVCKNNTLTDITNYWKGPGGKQEQLQSAMATWQTAINAMTAGAPKTAMQRGYDATQAHMTMFINDSELQWRAICSHYFVRP